MFEWNDKGYAIGIKKPIITSVNKDELALKKLDVYSKIKNRKNILLLGDNLEDVNMVSDIEYDNLIKIGFLNKNVDLLLEAYLKEYDIVITNDGDFDFVNELIKKIFNYLPLSSVIM